MSDTIVIIEESINVVDVTADANTVTVISESIDVVEVSGIPGRGLPAGGLDNMRLVKKSDADYDVEWALLTPPPAGLDKEVQFNDGGSMGNDAAFRWDKNNETLKLGAVGTETFPDAPIVVTAAIDAYAQVIIHNTSAGESASGDFVVTADDGTDEMEYIDLGISSSAFNDPVFECTKAHDGYILNVSSADLVFAAGGHAASKTRFYAGGLLDTDHVLDITPSGITLVAGKTITDRPPIFYGTGSPPDPAGLPDGAIFMKHE